MTLEGKVIDFGQFWSDPSMQEEFAEPALYVKSGYLEVSFSLQDARWIRFTRLITWFFLLVPKKENTYKSTVKIAALREIYHATCGNINGLDVLDRKLPKD